jgi:transposase-like protein
VLVQKVDCSSKDGKPGLGYSWRVDETYVKVKGKWAYLYRTIDKRRCTIDFYLSSTRNAYAAKVSYHKP